MRALARRDLRRHRVRRIAHVFATRYQAVDQELPALLARLRPDALIMFGLASRTRHVRIETRARNALSRRVPDAGGHLPQARRIAPEGPAALRLPLPAHRLLAAVRAAGLAAALSRDAGDYLCNYLCWRAASAAGQNSGPRLVAFVHVPDVHRIKTRRPRAPRHRVGRRRAPAALADLVRAGEAILRTVGTLV